MTGFPSRFRRRLAIVATALVAVSTAAFGVGSYLFIQNDKVTRFEAAARREVALRLLLSAGEQTSDVQALVSAFEQPGRSEVLIAAGGQVVASERTLDLSDVPSGLAELDGEVAEARATVDGRRQLVLGALLPDENGVAYFFYDLASVQGEIDNVARILGGAWVVVVLGAALVGGFVSRRTLAPVARAAEAARAIAQGDLHIRLPAEGDDEFAAWSAAFNSMADAVEERIWREQRVNAGVAHELRTPLGAMVTSASLLAEHFEQLPPPARRPAELLVDDARRLRRLVDDLLELAALGSGQLDVHSEPVDLLSRCRHIIATRKWSSAVKLYGTDTRVTTDGRRVERVVTNLIENALTHGGGQAEVEIGSEGDRSFIAVIDHGPGIPTQQRSHVFEPFHKSDPSRPGPGSGLGLTIALEQARVLGGGIDLHSEPGDGARFNFWIPARPLQSEVRRR